jgi:hypothetical protein
VFWLYAVGSQCHLAKNRKIGQADPLASSYTLAWRNYDPLETRRTPGCYKLADSIRRLIYTVPVEAVERSPNSVRRWAWLLS